MAEAGLSAHHVSPRVVVSLVLKLLCQATQVGFLFSGEGLELLNAAGRTNSRRGAHQ